MTKRSKILSKEKAFRIYKTTETVFKTGNISAFKSGHKRGVAVLTSSALAYEHISEAVDDVKRFVNH